MNSGLANIDIRSIDPARQLRDIDRADYEESLYEFYKAAWKHIDPGKWQDSWAIDAICEHLQAIIDGQITRLIVNCPPRIGKQVADETPVITTDGWKTHGELRPGEFVFHPTGVPTKVLATSGKSPSDVRVEFFDGSVFWCHENHEWALHNRVGGKLEILETGIFLRPRKGRWGQTNGMLKQVLASDGYGKLRAAHLLPKVWPLQWPERELPVHPYVLGAWLGDGSTKKPCLTHSDSDREHIARIVSLGYSVSTQHTHSQTGVITTYFAKGPLRADLKLAGVFGDKHIPEPYLRSSIPQRLELLAGLIDTDGSVDEHSRCHFSNTNARLIEAVSDLVRSFGWRASVCEHPPVLSSSGIQAIKPCFVVSFQPSLSIPTALPRKQIKRFPEDRRIGLRSVERDPCGKFGHCIQVEAPDGQYLIGKNLTPTHNSSLSAVALPAWTWAQPKAAHTSGPGVAFLYASYADKLALRDSVKCRRLIESQWYQNFWGHRYQLTSDQNTKSRFSNDQGGERLITSIGAGVTGEGGAVIIIDDPQAANEVASEANVQEVLDWWTQVMPTRPNDQELSAIVVIQQRLAENDLTGHILGTESEGWTHLCLPGRYEQDRSFVTTIGWKDPRTEPDELLWPERFSENALKRLEKTMGPYIFAGQIQQRPEPKGGGIIKLEWWGVWDQEWYPPFDFLLGCLDTAYTEDTANDPSGMIVWGVFSDSTKSQVSRLLDSEGRPIYMDRTYDAAPPKAMLCHAWEDYLDLHKLVERVAESCKRFKIDLLLIENKASGISVAQEISRLYSNERFGVQLFDPKSQDKFARLYSVQHLFAEGIVYAPKTKWADMVIKQVGSFGGKPGPKHDEFVDLTSMGLRHLRTAGLLTRAPERHAELEKMKEYHRSLEPLYPV
jgi:predicted phage terminase large subunit-like protein